MNRYLTIIFFLSLLFGWIAGCGVSYEKVYPTLIDNRYDSEFPYKSSSIELEKISSSIHRINTTAFYKTFVFRESGKVTLEKLRNINPDELAEATGYADKTNSGTATCVYSENGTVALLTCSHILSFQDTVVSFFPDENGAASNYLETISVKQKQLIYAAGFPDGSRMDLIVNDVKSDIAIIGRRYSAQDGFHFPVFEYPAGNSNELEWGTFVYIFGYPLNYKMITKAIISSPRKEGDGPFLVDAVINPGFSGGPVLAIRDGIPNFELVGIVQWVPEEEEFLITPEKFRSGESYSPIVPYKGDVYVRKNPNIRYGIARVITIEAIKKFINNNSVLLKEKGYYIFN